MYTEWKLHTPLDDCYHTSLCIACRGYATEQIWVLSPVGGVFQYRRARKDEGRCSQGREITCERRYRFQKATGVRKGASEDVIPYEVHVALLALLDGSLIAHGRTDKRTVGEMKTWGPRAGAVNDRDTSFVPSVPARRHRAQLTCSAVVYRSPESGSPAAWVRSWS